MAVHVVPFMMRPRFSLVFVLGCLSAAALLAANRQEPQGKSVASLPQAPARVLELEGYAAKRGPLEERWRPLRAQDRIAVGDWLQTGARGAHALSWRNRDGAEGLLGPNGLLEWGDSGHWKLMRGDLEVRPGAKPITVQFRDQTLQLKQPGVVAVRNRQLLLLEEQPAWLRGYHQHQFGEAMGSLLANVDGRETSLTLGYHKVVVDVRDQIARTRIEESFQNHTDQILEGVFYFPLPAEASISGFAMWIGEEKVEGEIVEKQRARQIYETILREKRDPGLLEWAGGNLFKARVYPIPARREKRIQIQYTQVLSKQDGVCRYRYPLRSELLQLNPLRELDIQVHIASAQPLADVRCLSHPTRLQASDHAASVEFQAREFTPEKDFELELVYQEQEPTLTAVSHVRGGDGYFMLLLDTPKMAVEGERSEPLDLWLLVDTSGSMMGPDREAQLRFVDAFLASLSPRDRVQLWTLDTQLQAAFPRPVPYEREVHRQGMDFLEARRPLGWSRLGDAFEELLQAAGENTQLIYIGDGQETSGAGDPGALAQRLKAAYRDRGNGHAVVPGNRSESLPLQAWASLGSGSFRRMQDAGSPELAAASLLAELSRPAMRDLEIQFEGLAVAAVYPQQLPNLPAGQQQWLLGRFDPLAGPAKGVVEWSGKWGNQEFRRRVPVNFSNADRDNAFLPRLWARRHLDGLLSQGLNSEIQQQVIRLSEDFQIITPLTSFLVLETEADRKRFQVQKRMRIRDGEDFFAEGRAQSLHELRRKQMQAAKSWRQNIRDQVLDQIATLYRHWTEDLASPIAALAYGELEVVERLGEKRRYGGRSDFSTHTRAGLEFGIEEEMEAAGEVHALRELGYSGDRANAPSSVMDGEWAQDSSDDLSMDQPFSMIGQSRRQETYRGPGDLVAARKSRARSRPTESGRGWQEVTSPFDDRRLLGEFPQQEVPASWPFRRLFPEIGAGHAYREIPSSWPPEVRALLQSLDRRPLWQQQNQALRLLWSQKSRVRPGSWRGDRTREFFFGPNAWALDFPDQPERARVVEAWWRERRMRVRFPWGLGRFENTDSKHRSDHAQAWVAPYRFAFGRGWWDLREYEVSGPESISAGKVKLSFRHPKQERESLELVLDSERAVVLQASWTHADGRVEKTEFSDFEQVAGAWWPTRIREWDEEGWLRAERELQITSLSSAEFESALKNLVEGLEQQALWLPSVWPSLEQAQNAQKNEKWTFADAWVLLNHHAAYDRWEEAELAWKRLAEIQAGRPGLHWLRLHFLKEARRGPAWREQAFVLVDALKEGLPGELDGARQLFRNAQPLQKGAERLKLLDALTPIYDRYPKAQDLAYEHHRWRLETMQTIPKPRQAMALRRRLQQRFPHRLEAHTDLARHLALQGEVDQALGILQAADESETQWLAPERRQLRSQWIQLLRSERRLVQLLARIELWRVQQPHAVPYLQGERLASLVYLNRVAEAEQQARAWLDFFFTQAEWSEAQEQGVVQSIHFWLGHSPGLSMRRIPENFQKHLWSDASKLLSREVLSPVLGEILMDYRLRDLPEGKQLRLRIYDSLVSRLEALDAERLTRLATWIRIPNLALGGERPSLEDFSGRILRRWQQSEDRRDRRILADWLAVSGDPKVVLQLRRLQFAAEESHEKRRLLAIDFLRRRMEFPWTLEAEEELLQWLPGVSDGWQELSASQGGDWLDRQVRALYDFVSWAVENRSSQSLQGEAGVGDRRQREFTREQLQRQAQRALAERLLAVRSRADYQGIENWLLVEALTLQSQAGEEPQVLFQRATEAIEALQKEYADHSPADVLRRPRILTARLFGLALQALLLDTEREEPRIVAGLESLDQLWIRGQKKKCPLLDWREARWLQFLAFDQVEALQKMVPRWYGGGRDARDRRFGLYLGQLFAELDDLPKATALYREMAYHGDLGHEAWRHFADWWTALDQREAADDARQKSWMSLTEEELRRGLDQDWSRYRRRGDQIPEQVDQDLVWRMRAYCRKANSPQSAFNMIRRYYEPTKDSRLLEQLSSGVLGLTPGSWFPSLNGLQPLLNTVQEESAIDRALDGLEHDLQAATDSSESRVLALLEFHLCIRALQMKHGVEDFRKRALAALQRAALEDFAWKEGQAASLVEFLSYALHGNLSEVKEPVFRILHRLRSQEQAASLPWLMLSGSISEAHWQVGERQKALEILDQALKLRLAEVEGEFSRQARALLNRHNQRLQEAGRFLAAESWLQGMTEKAPNRNLAWEYRRELYRLYRSALEKDGLISIGRGPELLQNGLHRMEDAFLNSPLNEGQVEQGIREWSGLLKAAKRRKIRDLDQHTRRFAYGVLPQILDRFQYREGQDMVRLVSDTLAEVDGSLASLVFLVGRAEVEPAWLQWIDRDFWSRQAWRLARRRESVGEIQGTLRQRLLAIVLRELEADMRSGRARNRQMYDLRQSRAWKEPAAEYAATARKVLQELKHQEPSLLHICDYLFHGLNQRQEVLQIFAEADQRGVCSNLGRRQWVRYLQTEQQWEASLPLLLPLLRVWPNDLEIHRRHLEALALTGRPDAARQKLAQIREQWLKRFQWNENTMASLAEACFRSNLLEQAASLYQEAIQVHAPRQGGDATLSHYHQQRALALSQLGQSYEAVQAGAGAVVAWGRRLDDRRLALQALEKVLAETEDLAAMEKRLDQEAVREGRDVPLLRKLLGKVRLQRGQEEAALVQLALAADLSPQDLEIYELQIRALDGLGRGREAIQPMLASAVVSGHRPAHYLDLGQRFALLEQEDEALRAWTTTVEMMPEEGESHRVLAELWESRQEWWLAEAQWRRVVTLLPEEVTGYLGLARVLQQLGRTREAGDVLQQMKSRLPVEGTRALRQGLERLRPGNR